MNSKITIVLVTAIVVGGLGFWGGMTYGQSQANAQSQSTRMNFSGSGRAGGRNGGGTGAVFGTIVAKDASSITVQLGGPNATSTNGASTGSKVVFYDASTQIAKTVAGSIVDLSVGENVTVGGTQNTDGSVSAATIQIRPAGNSRGSEGQ